MIKVETIGMLDIAKNNPVLTSTTDVKNYSFLTVDGILYLISNTLSGDDAYVEDAVIPKGEYLNGFQVKAWEGQKLFVDGKHITDDLSSVAKNDTLIVSDGALKKGAAPATGVYFKVTDTGLRLTEPAVKVIVCVVDEKGA